MIQSRCLFKYSKTFAGGKVVRGENSHDSHVVRHNSVTELVIIESLVLTFDKVKTASLLEVNQFGLEKLQLVESSLLRVLELFVRVNGTM